MLTADGWTDRKLEEMEKHLRGIYRRAEKEVGEAWKAYMKAEDAEVSRLGEAYGAAKASGDAAAIRSAGIAVSKAKQERTILNARYQRLTEEMAESITNVNQTAAAYINGQLPQIYSVNYNSVAKYANGAMQGRVSFDLVDAGTIRRLSTQQENLLPYKYVNRKKDVRWNVAKINSEVTQGILQGESIPNISKRLSNVLDMNATSAIRNARTTVTSAQNKGRMDMLHNAEDKGVIMKKGWSSHIDGRERPSHAALDGDFVGIDEEFSNGLKYPGDPDGEPEEVYNCFIGETNIASDSEIVRSYKHEYSGKLVTVKTAGGVNFTCTPNHPILTVCGWVKAESLQNGDNLIVTFGQKDFSFRIDPDVNHAFPRIDAIHKFFDKLGGKRTCALGVNFHGDIPTSDVEIITKKGLLRAGRNSSVFNSINKFLLKHTGKSFLRNSTFVEHFWRVCKSALCIVSGFSKAFPLVWCSLRHSEIHRFSPIALLYSGRVKPLNNDVTRNAELLGECLNGFSGVVFADNIVSVDFNSGCSHVYNLQTENGYYFVNSSIAQSERKSNGIFAIAHNCRCSLIYDVVGFR